MLLNFHVYSTIGVPMSCNAYVIQQDLNRLHDIIDYLYSVNNVLLFTNNIKMYLSVI